MVFTSDLRFTLDKCAACRDKRVIFVHEVSGGLSTVRFNLFNHWLSDLYYQSWSDAHAILHINQTYNLCCFSGHAKRIDQV